jgi:hypothetical protein
VSESGRRADRTAADDAWYVYGVIPADDAYEGLLSGVPGVTGAGVSWIAEDGLAAIVSTVPLAEFGEEAIGENLRDPAWLEQGVRAHEAVLERALGAAAVVPFRFGTIYRDESRVRRMLADEGKSLADALDRVRGKVEFGVKGFLVEPVAATSGPRSEREASAGRRYLEGKQQARRLAEEQEALRGRYANEAHGRLAAAADEAVANPLQPREVSGRDADMFLNGAYLVATERQEEFRAAVSGLDGDFGADGARFDLTGPWPPFNFVGDVV